MRKKIKNKIIIWEALSNIAGGQRSALNIVNGLKNRYEFEVIVPSEGPLSETLRGMNIPVKLISAGSYNLGKKNLTDIVRFIWHTPINLWRVSKIVKTSDLIYANSARVFIWSAILGLILHIPVIWHLRLLFVDNKTKILFKIFGRLGSVKKIIAVSFATANQFFGLKHKIEVIYNGVDISKFNINFQREKGILQKEERTIGIIADLIPQKGHKTLLKVIHSIKNEIPISLLIVGAPRENTKRYEKGLKDIVGSLKLDEIVKFLGYRTDIPEILNTVHLLIVPSSSSFEACPNVVLEAYACGVPVIGSDLGGTPELIENGKTGFIFRAEDEKDLAQKILLILNNSELYEEMKKNCRVAAEEKFDLKITVGKIESVLNQILKK